MDAPVESRYKIEDTSEGFKISSKDRRTTYVNFDGMMFYVDSTENSKYSGIGLFECHKLCSKVADSLMLDWVGPAEKVLPDKKRNWKIFTWAKQKTAMALAKKINTKRLALMEKANKLAVAIQKTYYAATASFNTNLVQPGLFKEDMKYVAQDFAKYRAAALTAKSMTFHNMGQDFQGWYIEQCETVEGFDNRQLVHQVPNWINIYSGKRKPNGPLRKTLMVLPTAIPYRLLQNLVYRDITRPFYNRLELMVYLAGLGNSPTRDTRNALVIERSNRPQVKHAMQMIWDHLRTPKSNRSTRKTMSICTTMQFIYDYPDGHNGNIVGLADKSIRWHRERRYLGDRKFCTYENTRETKLPSIPLPTSTNIRFLKTVGDIFTEGDTMSHCVGSYAKNAVEGKSFLFHVDYGEEAATVEVSPAGYVGQARGPHNSSNKATKWAERVLKKWAEGLTSMGSNTVEPPF